MYLSSGILDGTAYHIPVGRANKEHIWLTPVVRVSNIIELAITLIKF
jgi:hypothetical protein